MTLRKTIYDTYITYFKEKNVLKEAYSEIKTAIVLEEKKLWKTLDDSQVKDLIQTYVNKMNKAIKEFEKNNIVWDSKQKLINEVNELSQYLDKPLSGEELKEKVSELIYSGVVSIGDFMRKIKTYGSVNMGEAKMYFEELTK